MSHRPCKDPTLFHLNKSCGRYSTWVRRPNEENKRQYIGYFTTFHMAARAQDRAVLKVNPDAPLNFKVSDYLDDAELRATLSETAFLTMVRNEGRPKYTVVKKSLCFEKFQRMEDHFDYLRKLTKLNIRELVAHLATNPTPLPEMNQAAEILLAIFTSPTPGDLVTPVMRGSISKSIDKNVLDLNIPTQKRSPRTRTLRGHGVASSSEDTQNRPQTRGYCERKLEMSPSCAYGRRPRV